MKKGLGLFLAATATAFCMLSAQAQTDYWSDSANRDNTWPTDWAAASLTISTAAELAQFMWLTLDADDGETFAGKTIILADDIDLSGHLWSPVKAFEGTFHGQGHTITGLTVSNEVQYAGLFGIVESSAVVRDVKLAGADVYAFNSDEVAVGGVAGVNNGTIVNCSVSGSVNGVTTGFHYAYVGGVAGQNYGAIVNCSASGSVFGKTECYECVFAGGVAGWNEGTIANCRSTCMVSGETVYDDYFLYIGGVAGVNYGRWEWDEDAQDDVWIPGVVSNCYWLLGGADAAFGSNNEGSVSNVTSFNGPPGTLASKNDDFDTYDLLAALNAYVEDVELWKNGDGVDIPLKPWAASEPTSPDAGYPVLKLSDAPPPAQTVTVTFRLHGGALADPTEKTKVVTVGEAYGTLPDPTRADYEFAGWFTGRGHKITEDLIVLRAQDHNLHAHWVKVNITVTFDANGGEPPVPDSMTVKTGETYGENGPLPDVSFGGRQFAGWFTQATGGTLVTDTTEVTATDDHTLYAHWIKLVQTVTFHHNAGGVTVTPSSTKDVDYGQAYGDLPTAERTGYEFVGWFTRRGGGSKVEAETLVTQTDDHNLYAHWARIITVTFDPNGTDAAPAEVDPTSMTVKTGEKYGENEPLPVPTRDGYEFLGWFMPQPQGGDVQVTAGTEVTATDDHTLYAHWAKSVQTVTFHHNAGGVTVTPFETKDVNYGQAYGDLPTAERMGYEFLGWFTRRGGGTLVAEDTEVTRTDDHNLYAHWAKIITVTFDPNNGDPLDPDPFTKVVLTGQEYGELPVPTRDGYEFRGWYTTASGAGSRVTADTQVTATDDHTLYARWARIYTVTFNPQGGTVDPTSKGVTVNRPYGELPVPTREGYLFLGWRTVSPYNVPVNADTVVWYANDHTLYARWERLVRVDFDLNDTADEPADAIDPDWKWVRINNPYSWTEDGEGYWPRPTREGYAFLGWYTTASGGGLWIRGTMDVSAYGGWNRTLYARWERLYRVDFDLNDNDGGPAATAIDPDWKWVRFNNDYSWTADGEGYWPLMFDARPGYTWLGWWTTPEGPGGYWRRGTTTVYTRSDHTLYSRWRANTYVVTYDPQGGSDPSPTNEYAVVFNTPYGEQPTTVLQGYTFEGWWTAPGGASGGGTQVFTDTIYLTPGDSTVYAAWRQVPFLDNPCSATVITRATTYDGFLYDNGNDVRGTMTLTATSKTNKKTGEVIWNVTAKFSTATGNSSLVGTWDGVSAYIELGGKSALCRCRLSFGAVALCETTLCGEYIDKDGSVFTVSGAKNIFADAANQGAQLQLGQVSGLYNVAFQDKGSAADSGEPETRGYMSFTIGKAGVVKFAGMLADGTTFSGSTKLIAGLSDAEWPNWLCIPVYKTLYGKKGYVSALLWINPADLTVRTDAVYGFDVDWVCNDVKKGGPFAHQLAVIGGYFGSGTTPPMTLVAPLTFSAAVPAVLPNPAGVTGGAWRTAAFPVGLNVNVSTDGTKLSLSGNAAAATLAYTAATGLYKGAFTLYFDGIASNGKAALKTAKVSYAGVVIRTRDGAYATYPLGGGVGSATINKQKVGMGVFLK